MAAGYRSFEAFFIGGSSANPVTVVAGYRSPEALWIGGASAGAAAPTTGGYRSFEAAWIGGSEGFTAVPPIPTPTGGGAGTKTVRQVKANKFHYPGERVQYTKADRDRILLEDDDLILLWAIVLKNQV